MTSKWLADVATPENWVRLTERIAELERDLIQMPLDYHARIAELEALLTTVCGYVQESWDRVKGDHVLQDIEHAAGISAATEFMAAEVERLRGLLQAADTAACLLSDLYPDDQSGTHAEPPEPAKE